MPVDPKSIAQYAREQVGEKARHAAIGASHLSPEQVARARRLASSQGVTVDEVVSDIDRYAELDRLDRVQRAAQESPALGQWLQKPENSAIARDDIGNLSKLSAAMQDALNRDGGDIALGLRQGANTVAKSLISLPVVLGNLVNDPLGFRLARSMYSGLTGKELEQHTLLGLFSEQKYFHQPEAVRETVAGIEAAEKEDFERNASAKLKQQQAEFDNAEGFVDTAKFLGRNPSYAGHFLLTQLAPLILGRVPGSVGGTVAAQGVIAGGGAAAEVDKALREKGLSEDEIAASSSAAAASSAIINSALAYGIPGGTAVERALAGVTPKAVTGGVIGRAGVFAKAAAGEAASEGLTEAADQVSQNFFSLDPLGKGVGKAAVMGAALGGGFGAAAGAAQAAAPATPEQRRVQEELGAISQSIAASRKLENIVEAAQASQLAQQSPEAFAELLSSTTSPDANVYLDVAAARTLFQSERIGADAFIDELVGEQGAAFEAAATGGDLVIPLADFVAKLAHRPDAAEIARHARLDASHVSRAELESESFMDEQLAKWFGDTDEAAARAQPVESEAGRERVKQDVLGMLMATGRYKSADAEANAEALSLMVGRLADMAGVDPWEHYARYRLRINNQGGQQVAGQKPNTIDPVSDGLLMDALNGVMPSENAERREEIQSILRALDEHEVLREKSPSELAAMNRQDIWDMLFPEDVLEQTAYHGTPHRGIEKTGFKLNAIGTGEGAQAYGWGIYFASQKEVAEGYRASTSRPEVEIEGRRYKADAQGAYRDADGRLLDSKESSVLSLAARALYGSKANKPLAELAEEAESFLQTRHGIGAKRIETVKRAILNGEIKLINEGQLYQVDIPEDSDLLDWDKPLSQQSPKVSEAVLSSPVMGRESNGWRGAPDGMAERSIGVRTGKEIYLDLVARFGTGGDAERKASEHLNSLGIPGLRYLDGNSRAAGDGSHNYVIWDEALLTPEAAKIEALYQSPAESGASSLEAEIAAERTATERAYGGRAAYDKAKAEGRTKLTYHQWIEVRTPRFRQWFGDWEAIRAKDDLQKMEAITAQFPAAFDADFAKAKEAARIAFGKLREETEANGFGVAASDGRQIKFSGRGFKELSQHAADRRVLAVGANLKPLFESAVPLYSVQPSDKRQQVSAFHYYGVKADFGDAGQAFVLLEVIERANGEFFYDADATSLEEIKAASHAPLADQTKSGAGGGNAARSGRFAQWWNSVNPAEVSKVVDPETGEPLVVYHGTDADFDVFDAAKASAGKFGKGFYFTQNKREAETYAYANAQGGSGRLVVEAFVNARNPFETKSVFSFQAQMVSEGSDSASSSEHLLGKGHDGVVSRGREGVFNELVAFHPNQIKSATANNGNYSADSDSTLEQQKGDTPRGQIRFLPERTFSIDLFEGADGSTFMHEAAHFVLEQMQDLAEQSEAVKVELDRVRAWLGNEGGKFTTDEHERFARGFELYLREGKAPVPGLRRLFERMKNWLMQAYKHALELNVALNDDIRGVFDRLLASEAEIEAAKRKQGDNPLALSKEARGLLKPGQYEKYVEAREAALAEAREALLAKLNAAERRKHEQWWKKELKALVAQKLAEIDASPAGRAQQRMRADKSLRLDKAALVARYGKAWTQDSLRALGVYTVKGRKSASSPAVLAATMERGAQTLDEARKHAKTFVGQPLTNQSTGLEARVSNTNLGKMTSEKAGKKSSTAADHALAVANVDKLFRNALLDHSHADSKGEPTIAAIHRYVAPMVTRDGRVVAVKMTVKETTGPKEPNPVYSIETLDIQNPPSVLSRVNPDGTGIHPQAGFSANVLQRMDEVKNALQPASGGLNPETAAMLFGFDSGDALVKALADLPNMRARAKDWALSEMYARHGDPMTDGSLPEAAMEAIHGNKRLQLLEKELGLLSELAGQPFPPLAVVREYARRKAAGMPVRKLKPNTHLTAARRAALKMARFAAEGKFAEALQAKRQEAISIMLYREALAAQKSAKSVVNYLKRFTVKKRRAALGKAGHDYLEQVDGLLAAIDLRYVSEPEATRRKTLAEWVERQRENGHAVEVPEKLLNAAFRKPYQDMTLDELTEVRDTVKQIAHLADLKGKLRLGAELRDAAEVDAEMAESVLNGHKAVDTLPGMRSKRGKLKDVLGEYRANLASSTDIARELDGYEEQGAVWRHTVGVMREAVQTRLNPEMRKAQEGLAGIYLKHYSRQELGKLRKTFTVDGVRGTWTREMLLALAFNRGNVENWAAVLGQHRRGLTSAEADILLQQLDARDWAFVQDGWDFIDSYWPQIAETQRRRKGLVPKKVEATAFTVTTHDGKVLNMRGGYYPLKYASDDVRGKQEDAGQFWEDMRSGRFVTASTRDAHAKERVGSGGREVRLDLAVLDSHLSDVVRDLCLGDAVNYVYSVLNGRQFKSAVSETGNAELLKGLDIWLRDVAIGEMAVRGVLEKSLRFARTNFTAAVLTWKPTSALLQLTGVFQTAAVIGSEYTLHGVKAFLAHPRQMWGYVTEHSPFMAARAQAHIEAVQQVTNARDGRFKAAYRAMIRYGYWMIGKLQQLVDTVTWLAAEKKGMALFDGDVARARQYADDIVARAQGSGEWMDKNALQRGSYGDKIRQSEVIKATTVLQSYMMAKASIIYAKTDQLVRDVDGFNGKSLAAGMRYAWDMVLLLALEGIVIAAINGKLPSDEDDDDSLVDDWMWLFFKDSASNLFGGVPGLGSMVTEFRGHDAKGVVASAWEAAAKSTEQISQAEADAALAKNTVTALGFATGIPSSQINKTIDAIAAEADGKDVSPFDYIRGVPKKKDRTVSDYLNGEAE